MKTLRDERCRGELIARLEKLTGNEKGAWGKMTVDQMLSHLVQTGELPFNAMVGDRSTIFLRRIIKPLILYVLPMPKEVQIGPEIDQQRQGRPPVGFDVDKADVVKSINELGTLSADLKCLDHPFFGRMSAKEWAVLGHKHIDHHLRQFGV